MNRKFVLLATLLSVSATCWAESDDCGKSLHDYLGLLSITAYTSGDVENLVEVDQLIKNAKKDRVDKGSCEALDAAKKSDIARKLTESHAPEEASPGIERVEGNNVEREIDWATMPGHYAITDRFIADEFATTIASCNAKYPSNEEARTRSLELFFVRIDYTTLKEKADHFVKSSGKSNELAAMQMMGSFGEDTREWSQEKCDDYAKHTPFDRLYATRERNN